MELGRSSLENCSMNFRTELILRVPDCIVTISFECILYCGCFNLFCNVWVCVCVGFVMCGCVCMCGFCNVWVCVCVGFVMCGCVYVWVL